ncbi:MAG: phosphatidate cytidylyltransferase [Oscillospiraceae bacterium]
MNIKKRLLPAALIVLVTGACVLLSRPTRVLFFVALGIMSAFELQEVLKEAGYPISRALLSVYIAAQGVLCWFRVEPLWMCVLYALAVFAAMFWGILQPDKGAKFAVGNVFVLGWPFAFYAIILYAAASDIWLPVMLLAILGGWACDSMALIGGKLCGKHKLSPRVSPNKTWEGAIIGAVFSVLAGFLISLILKSFYPVPALTCMIIALVASSFGQVGDLAASLIKRMAGVKDYGSLMPEHGGIMDKMDSMLFSIPAAYLCLHLAGI